MSLKKTTCVLCAMSCGLEMEVEGNRIVKVLPDKDSPVSEGYICRKGTNVAYHQHNADRVLYPLKKVDGKFERISWDRAVSEISSKLKALLQEHGPRCLSSVAGGGEFSLYPGRFVSMFVRSLGSQYLYSAANQEFSGRFWAHGLTLGSQALEIPPDYEHTEMLMAIGWNGMMSHQIPQARRVLTRISKDPGKLLVVVDPRLSETAKIADIHLALRPGTDALLLKSMIAIILREGWHNKGYVRDHTEGFDKILPWFEGFDVKAALKVCGLDYDLVLKVCREFTHRQSCLRDDLGLLMGRHSSYLSYLLVVLLAVCGRIGVAGGNYLAGGKLYSDPNDPKTWRTTATDIPAICGMFPPNVMPEEILSGRPDRLRAVFVCGANPLRSYADTTAYEEGFRKLDLLVVAEMVMSETAALAHYVLPSKSGYESFDSPFNLPLPSKAASDEGEASIEMNVRMRHPVVVAEGEQKEAGEIFTLLADAMGLVPALPETLYKAALGDLKAYRDALVGYLMENPASAKAVPFIAVKTLGSAVGSSHLALYFATHLQTSKSKAEDAANAGFAAGPDQGIEIYKAVTTRPEGVVVGRQSITKNLGKLATQDGRIHLHSEQVESWIKGISAAEEEQNMEGSKEYPLVLMAGRHMDMNANTAMRDPAWNEGRKACTMAMSAADAKTYGFADGQRVRVVTEAGAEELEVEVTESAREGQVVIPHGFGLVYNGVKYGANVNRLTKNTNRDHVGTPIHRYVPCRVEAL
jgi:anaerobic selenocysteine-containing dehydrogenase